MTTEAHENIVERLFASFIDLEKAIEGARVSLQKKDSVPKEVFDRLDSYGGILAKQRRLAHSLAEHVKNGNTVEVARHVSIINGLSGMIIEDAKAILESLSTTPTPVELGKDEDFEFC